MDLNIKDVAELLSVSETRVRKWLSRGLIPAYRLNQEFRFSRIEIESWVMNRKIEDDETDSTEATWTGTQQYSLYRAIHKGDVLVGVEGCVKEDVIRDSMKQMAKTHEWDAGVFTDLLLDRESLMPTALTNGIGVPHAREFLLPETFDVLSVVFPKEPIEYGALDGQKVHTLFFLFACQDKSHLHLLAKLAHLANSERALEYLKTKPEKNELLTFIKSWESDVTSHSKLEVSAT